MRHIKTLSTDEFLSLTTTIEKYANERDYLLLMLLITLGIRGGEVLLLKRSDLLNSQDNPHSIWITALKGSRSRYMPLPDDLWLKLKTYADNCATQVLFDISKSRLKQIWHEYSPQSCRGKSKQEARGIHSLRHNFAIDLYKRERNIRMVQTALGHQSIDNTLIYMTYVESGQELRKAMYGKRKVKGA